MSRLHPRNWDEESPRWGREENERFRRREHELGWRPERQEEPWRSRDRTDERSWYEPHEESERYTRRPYVRGERDGESEYERGGSTAGRYRGMGPRSYRRSDERVREDVNDRLTDHPDIDASDIDVEVIDCEVRLTGIVEDRMSKRMAEDIADSVSGVRDVRNELRIRNRDRSGSESRAATGPWRDTSAMSGGSRDEAAGTMSGATSGMLVPEMEVHDRLDEPVGRVKAVRPDAFVLNRPMKRDLYVPMHAVKEVRYGRAMLDIPAEKIDEMGWQPTEIVGKGKERRA